MLLYCGVASVCLGAEWALLFEGNSWAGFPFLVLSRVLLTLCLSLQYRAVCEIKKQPASKAWLAGPPLGVFAVCTWFSFVDRNLSALVILFTLIQIAVMIRLVVSLLQKDGGQRPFVDVVIAGNYAVFIAITAGMVLSLLWNSYFSTEYNFNNPRSIYVNLLAICIHLGAFSMYPVMVSERLNRELTVQALRDPLTGLYNRRAFEEFGFREIAGATRTGQPISIMIFDLDHFKEVNDQYGHAAGDAVLKAVADTLIGVLRDEDILCRWGGDEFCALLPRANQEHARSVAERMMEAMARLALADHGKQIGVDVSIGIMTDWDHSRKLASLVELADAALYRAKNEGRRRLAFAFDENASRAE